MPDLNDRRLARPHGQPEGCVVTVPAADVREAPAPLSQLMTQALMGELADVFQRENGYTRVQLRRDRYVGWVREDALAPAATETSHKVSALRTFAFTAPDVKSPARFALSLGARLTATGRQDGPWTEFAGAGWMHAAHLAALNVFETDPVSVAARFFGTPYLWGGRESLGLDCSGLLQQAFEACGVLLPRDSDMQAEWAGEPVADWQSPGALRRGDLVFWAGHVGILTSPDELLHANAFHMAVAVEPLDEVVRRIRTIAGDVTQVRRLDVAAARGTVPHWYAVP